MHDNETRLSLATASNQYTRSIADFVSGLRNDRIPQEVRQRIKLLVPDALSCGMYGADLEWSRILERRLGEVDATRCSESSAKPMSRR
jgi:2-methylcitrate dehydratase PrpD